MLSEVFYSLLVTSTIGFLLALSRLCYKSKCETIEIGLSGVRIVRDVQNEEKIDEIQINQQNSNKDNLEEKV